MGFGSALEFPTPVSFDTTPSGIVVRHPDVFVSGIIQLASVPGAVGDPLYLDTTNGLLTATAPTGSQEIVRVMGYKLDTNRVYFNPSQDWLEIV